jgi:nucleotidyltransferase/DNA polymerase involved in DNA repair
MHYIAHVRIARFYSSVLGLEGDARPAVVHRDGRVLDANEAALARHVRLDMPLSEAKAVVPEGRFLPGEEEPYREAQAAWLDVCAEFTDVVEPEESHTAFLDLSAHPEPLPLLERLREELSARRGHEAALGMAPCRWIARLASLRTGLSPVAWRSPREFVAPFPVEELGPARPEHRKRLRFLGYPFIRDVAEVPLSILRPQFGEAALTIHRAAQGGGDARVEPLYPPASLADRIAFDGEVDSSEMLRAALGRLARRLGRRLSDRDLFGTRVEMFFEHEEGDVTPVRRTFVKPLQSPASLLAALGKMAETPPERPPTAVRVRLPNLERARRVQQDLEGGRSVQERRRSVEAAFRHVRTVYGDGAVQVAGEMEEARRRRLLRAWKDATGWT